ncbi:hypothetical protein D9757_005000 [Collybiopsis confluens]|uniref:Uncharacterized protein n=1 Tax=Collybiopsis confluens TaxID=2823264 RepID=A0A8H5HT81_9AGAR|nr:hypothetical protein D9757_005000 [Collybiopsis confluens]
MSLAQDLEAPTIFVEAPPEDEQEDLIDSGYPSSSLNSAFQNEHPDVQALLRQVYPQSTSSSPARTLPAGPEQGLFSIPFDPSPLTAQISPLITAGLRDGSAGNIFLAPNDQNSPVDGNWSPSSASEGDVFSDNLSDCSSNWSPSIHASSPSSPSLSPLNTSFNNIILSDDNSAQAPAFYRHRSSSYTGLPDPQSDLGVRQRSASFTDVSSLGETSQGYSGQAEFIQSLNQYNASAHSNGDYSTQINQWLVQNQSESSSVPSFDPNVYAPSFDPAQWNTVNLPNLPEQPVYQPPPGPPPPQVHGSHGRSLSTHLTVPSLQRRDAHRRSHSHTGINQDSARGRPRFSPGPSSRHSSQSRDPSPSSPFTHSDFPSYLNFGTHSDPTLSHFTPPLLDFLSPISTSPSPSSPNSPASLHSHTDFLSPTSPSSPSPQSHASPDSFYSPGLPSSSSSSSHSHSPLPSNSITIHGQDSEPQIISVEYSGGVARRHTHGGGMRSRSTSRSNSPLPDVPSPGVLHRTISDPIGQHKRKARAPTVQRKYPGLLKPAKEVDEAGSAYPESIMINVPIEGVHSAPPPAEFKSVIGSDKIVQASNLRRKNEPKFVCELCGHRFTAKHNLMSESLELAFEQETA